MDAFELLYNNSASIEDVSKPLEGTVLSVCDICEYMQATLWHRVLAGVLVWAMQLPTCPALALQLVTLPSLLPAGLFVQLQFTRQPTAVDRKQTTEVECT